MTESNSRQINGGEGTTSIAYLDKLKQKSKNLDKLKDRGIVNESNGSSVSIKNKGDVNMSSAKLSQYNLSKNNNSTELTMKSSTITNRKEIYTDEVILNDHKLNPQEHELADMRNLLDNPNKAIGNLNSQATALIKTWEPNLNKWVLIRREMRFPTFYPKLNIPDMPEEMDIDTNSNLSDSIQEQLKVITQTEVGD